MFGIGAGTDSFVLSVTIAFASGLTALVQPGSDTGAGAGAAADPGPPAGPYCFFYSLLGKDESTPTFADLQSPIFNAQRSAFRIKSSESELIGFLSQVEALQVHLVSGDNLLGTATIPLLDLGRFADAGVGTKEGAFPLMHPDGVDVGTPAPVLGLTMMLRKELQMGPQAGGAGSSIAGGSEMSVGFGGGGDGKTTVASAYTESTAPSETTTEADAATIPTAAAAGSIAAAAAAARAAEVAVAVTTAEHAYAAATGGPELQQSHLAMLQQRLDAHNTGGESTTMTSGSETGGGGGEGGPIFLPRVSQQEMLQRLDIPRHFRCGVQIQTVRV